jgi:hypothetical protein
MTLRDPPMHSKYLKCDVCGEVLDRRPKDDFGGVNRGTKGQGTFAPGEWPELLRYAVSLGWFVSDDTHNGRHICPKHALP